jgi:hypothetical protein
LSVALGGLDRREVGGSLAESSYRVGGGLHLELKGHRPGRWADFRGIYRIDPVERLIHGLWSASDLA